MLSGYLREARYAARLAARRAVFGTVGGLMALIGFVFLTLAAWIYLAATLGPAYAALILGLVFLGFGLIVIALGSRHVPATPPPPPVAPRAIDTIALINAFLGGVSAGRGLRKK